MQNLESSMPPRISRGNVAPTGKQTNGKKKQKSQKRALNAFTAAQHEVEERPKIRSHRLGEVEPERGAKRRRVNEDEDGEDDDEDEDDERQTKKARGRGVNDSDVGSDSSGNEWRMGGEIGEDSDSSLDSDEAFGESDEEKFEGFTFRGSTSAGPGKPKKKSVKKAQAADGDEAEMDLDEDDSAEEEDDEDDFGDEGVDLATMLDNPPSDEEEDSGSEGDTESDSDDAQSTTSASEPESDSADAGKLSKLQDLVASLEGPASKAGSRSSASDVHETLPPSDYALTSRQKLQISDLLPTVTDPQLRKSLKVLASDKPSKRSGIPGKLSAPLPKRQQDKIDRSVAAAKAKEELDKWQDTVIQSRRAEHLSFPLTDPNASAPVGESQLVGVGEDRPANELEGAIRSILEESGLASEKKDGEEDRIRRGEELALKEVPVEEVMARRAALRKARELLFREEIRAKRIKKIKSKSYRRVHRREREREEGRRRELMGGDEGDEEAEQEKRDRERALERVGGRHKESRWAKGMKKSGRTVWDDDAREGVVDMARRNEELRRRIEGKNVRGDDESLGSEESDEEDEQSDFDEGSDVERDRVRRQLGRLEQEDEENRKGLGNMAFMKRAEAARKQQNEQTIADMRREIDGADGSDGELDEDTTIGRRVFGPKPAEPSRQKPKVVKNVLEEPESGEDDHDEEDAKIITEKPERSRPKAGKASSKPLSNSAAAKVKATKDNTADATDDIDAWMTAKTTSRKDKKRAPVQEYIPSPAQSAKPEKPTNGVSQSKSAKQQSKSTSSSAPDTTNWAVVPARPTTNGTAHDSDASDSDTSNPVLTKAQEQSLYHARAFAGDDVDLSFAAEKGEMAEDEDEKEISNHLPGWGSWTGTGLSKNARRANARQKHNPLFKTKVDGVRQADRRDAKLKNVIISEAQQRKGKKYLATSLPHEFERRDQYERSLRVPVGPEWTTKETFQRNTKPRVVVRQGVVEAIERPLL